MLLSNTDGGWAQKQLTDFKDTLLDLVHDGGPTKCQNLPLGRGCVKQGRQKATVCDLTAC